MEISDWHKSSHVQAYFIFFLASSFYLYEFVLQVAPSVMAKPMMHTFQVSAEGFGIISAFYFYAYAPMQLPAGVLFDRYGPRKLMTVALILCASGSVFFALTDSVVTACLGRFLIGTGSAFSFIGVLVLLSRWFPANYFAALAGIAQAMSSLGAMFGEVPLAALIDVSGWRHASYVLAAIGFLLAFCLWRFIRDFPNQDTQSMPAHDFRQEWRRLYEVCCFSVTWQVGVYACAIWTPIAVFAVLWGIPFLQEKYQVSTLVASSMCSMVWLGIAFGSPVLGWMSDYYASRRLVLALSGLIGLVASITVVYLPGVSFGIMYWVLFALGVGASGQTVSFAVVKDSNPMHLVGTACGFNNLSVLIGGAFFQPLVGVMLNHSTHTHHLDGAWIYSAASYQSALWILPLSYLLSLAMVMVMRESHPKRLKREAH